MSGGKGKTHCQNASHAILVVPGFTVLRTLTSGKRGIKKYILKPKIHIFTLHTHLTDVYLQKVPPW